MFTALNLARLPPVGVEHVDVCALLLEVAAIRQEVRSLLAIHDEIQELRHCMQHLPERNEFSISKYYILKTMW